MNDKEEIGQYDAIKNAIDSFRRAALDNGIKIIQFPTSLTSRDKSRIMMDGPAKPDFSRLGLLARDNFRCRFCGQDVSKDGQKNLPSHDAVVCHLIPVAKGGGTDYANCVTACVPCCTKKGDQTTQDAGMNVIPLTHPMFSKATARGELCGDGLIDLFEHHYTKADDPFVGQMPRSQMAQGTLEGESIKEILGNPDQDRWKDFRKQLADEEVKDRMTIWSSSSFAFDGEFDRAAGKLEYLKSIVDAVPKSYVDRVTPSFCEGDVLYYPHPSHTNTITILQVMESRGMYRVRDKDLGVTTFDIAATDKLLKKVGYIRHERDGGPTTTHPAEWQNQVTIE